MKLHSLSCLLTHSETNRKWFRFHQWQPWCNNFYINNDRVRLVSSDDIKEPELHYEPRCSSHFAKTFNVLLPSSLFKTVVLRLTEFFKDKPVVYIDIRPPGRIPYGISPGEDFIAQLFETNGSNIQYSTSLEEQRKGVRLNHLFSSETRGLIDETYLTWWLDQVESQVVKAEVFEPVSDRWTVRSLELEIEVVAPVVFERLKWLEDELRVRFEKHLADDHHINFGLIERSPAKKPYKQKCICLVLMAGLYIDPELEEVLCQKQQ